MSKSDKHKNNAINTPGKGKKTGKSQKRRLSSVRLPDSPGGRQNVDLPSSQATPTREVTHTESEVVPYDERLLERSRTQWQFGDWDSLVKLDRETLQHHPPTAPSWHSWLLPAIFRPTAAVRRNNSSVLRRIGAAAGS
jgi:hypothetical protein